MAHATHGSPLSGYCHMGLDRDYATVSRKLQLLMRHYEYSKAVDQYSYIALYYNYIYSI